jgi:hypothetical protein
MSLTDETLKLNVDLMSTYNCGIIFSVLVMYKHMTERDYICNVVP